MNDNLDQRGAFREKISKDTSAFIEIPFTSFETQKETRYLYEKVGISFFAEGSSDGTFIRHYRTALKLREDHPALKPGQNPWVLYDDSRVYSIPTGEEQNIPGMVPSMVAYRRVHHNESGSS
ncbi:hypothetical protein [Endozoicomonas ascidiicola]|uniref:hypothetical protein n=1 Tax=Endozoicomonas ascidiicola TaxID=1698521 RepID=UPI00082FE8A7|nr:hypothetical protein [Endozoicomonas ascidiicola]